MDDLQWIRDIIPTIKLEPNTLYHFEPNLTIYEISILRDKISEENGYMRRWLGGFNDRLEGYMMGIKYFATSESTTLTGWCNTTEYKNFHSYDSFESVNGRKLFNMCEH